MKPTPSQGRRLIMLLKRRPMTTMQMLQTGISVCPWKRISECLSEREQLVKTSNVFGRNENVYQVVHSSRWTA